MNTYRRVDVQSLSSRGPVSVFWHWLRISCSGEGGAASRSSRTRPPGTQPLLGGVGRLQLRSGSSWQAPSSPTCGVQSSASSVRTPDGCLQRAQKSVNEGQHAPKKSVASHAVPVALRLLIDSARTYHFLLASAPAPLPPSFPQIIGHEGGQTRFRSW